MSVLPAAAPWLVSPDDTPTRLTHASLVVFREQRSWAGSRSRAEGGGPPSRPRRCRSPLRPQESPRGQVQPHPGMNPCPSPPTLPSVPPFITHLWTFMSFFYNKEPRPVRLNRRNRVWCATDSYTSLKCIVLIPLFWEKKRFCTVCLFLFVLAKALYVFLCKLFKVHLCAQKHWMQGSHLS